MQTREGRHDCWGGDDSYRFERRCDRCGQYVAPLTGDEARELAEGEEWMMLRRRITETEEASHAWPCPPEGDS